MTWINASTLLPHRPPMVCVDRIRKMDEHSVESSFLVQGDFLFVDQGHIQMAGLLEHAAQTAAARGGLLGDPGRVGFIASFKNVRIHHLPSIGSELTTTLTLVQHVLDMDIYHFRTMVNEKMATDGEVRIAFEVKQT